MSFGSGSGSASSLGSFNPTTDIEILRDRGRSLIAKKDAIIARLHRELTEAERSLEKGRQLEIHTANTINDEIVALEEEFYRLQVETNSELESLRSQKDRELNAIRKRHGLELAKLEKELQRGSENQSQIAHNRKRASRLLKVAVERADASDDEDSLQERLELAKRRSEELQNEVAALETELADLAGEDDKVEVARERVIEADDEEELEQLKQNRQSEARKARGGNRGFRNEDLRSVSRSSVSGTASSRSSAESVSRKGRSRAVSKHSTPEAAAVRRLESENAELRRKLKEIDRIAHHNPY